MSPWSCKTIVACTVLCLLVGICPSAFCQTKAPLTGSRAVSSLALSVGVNDFNQRDRYLSPYTFSGTLFASSLSYRVRNGKDLQKIETSVSLGGLSSNVQLRDVYQDAGVVSYSYVHSLARWDVMNSPLDILLGGGISSLVMNTDFNSVDNVYGTTVYDQSWYWHHSLNLVILAEYRPAGRGSFALQFTAPVVGLVSRPKNGHWLNADNYEVIRNFGNAAVQGLLEPFWNAPVAFMTVEYTHSLTEHLNLRGSYSFAYVGSDRPADILSMGMYMNDIVAGAEWVF